MESPIRSERMPFFKIPEVGVCILTPLGRRFFRPEGGLGGFIDRHRLF
jgi:hypothetical protein